MKQQLFQQPKTKCVKQFKKFCPKWQLLSWQKSTQIQYDIRDWQSFESLVQFLKQNNIQEYPFNPDLVPTYEKIFFQAKNKYKKSPNSFEEMTVLREKSPSKFEKQCWNRLKSELQKKNNTNKDYRYNIKIIVGGILVGLCIVYIWNYAS